MLLRELEMTRLGARPRVLYAQPHPAYLNTAALSGYGAAFGRGPIVQGRMLYDGLGNPVGILPFIAALAPLAAKLVTALPAIVGKAATLLPKIATVAASLGPRPAPASPMPVVTVAPAPPPSPAPPPPVVAPAVPPEATQIVHVPMRAPNGAIVMVPRRLRRRRVRMSRPATVYRLPPAPLVTGPAPPTANTNPLRGWHG